MIDGTTQPGYAGRPIVTIDGAAVADNGFEKAGLYAATSMTVRGLTVENVVSSDGMTYAAGIVISNIDPLGIRSVVAGNDLINNSDGISVQDDLDGFLIGGTTSGRPKCHFRK